MALHSVCAAPDAASAHTQPKLAGHMNQCYGGAFTCIDCSVTFDRNSVQVSDVSAVCAAAHAQPPHVCACATAEPEALRFARRTRRA
jgi:hypothetical protein